MAALGQRVAEAAFGLVLKAAEVSAVRDLGPMRLIELSGADLVDQRWTPGDKLRIHTGRFDLRTYTPISSDGASGRAELLAYVHGDGPGTADRGAVRADRRVRESAGARRVWAGRGHPGGAPSG